MKIHSLILAIVLALLVGCSSSSNSGEGGETVSPLVLNAEFKAPILKLVEGSYSINCTRTINNQATTGLPITISATGVISWGDVSDDLTKLNTSTFTISRNHLLNTLSSKFESKSLTTGNRLTAYEIRVETTGKITASVTVHATNTVNTCERTTPPVGLTTSLWSEALKYIKVNETSIECLDSTTSNSIIGTAYMTETEAKVLNRTVLKSNLATESIFVYDVDAGYPAGLIYLALTNSSTYASLAITSQKKFNSLQITNADVSTVTCKTSTGTVP